LPARDRNIRFSDGTRLCARSPYLAALAALPGCIGIPALLFQGLILAKEIRRTDETATS
jgi:hypothetical protein